MYFGMIDISFNLKLVIEREAGLDLSGISRLNTSEKISGTHATLLDKDMGTLGPLKHGVMANYFFFKVPFAIYFK